MAVKRPVPEIPYKVPMIDQRGFVNPAWAKWFREMYVRNGGTLALNNIQLEEEAIEIAQDAVGSILEDSATVEFEYDDAVPSITATLIPTGISHSTISDVTTQDHKRHSTLTITRNGSGYITRLDWANGDYDIVSRDGNNRVTTLVGNVWTRTITRDGNNRISLITWTLT